MAAAVIPDARVVLVERHGRWWLEVFVEYWTLYRREISLEEVMEIREEEYAAHYGITSYRVMR